MAHGAYGGLSVDMLTQLKYQPVSCSTENNKRSHDDADTGDMDMGGGVLGCKRMCMRMDNGSVPHTKITHMEESVYPLTLNESPSLPTPVCATGAEFSPPVSVQELPGAEDDEMMCDSEGAASSTDSLAAQDAHPCEQSGNGEYVPAGGIRGPSPPRTTRCYCLPDWEYMMYAGHYNTDIY